MDLYWGYKWYELVILGVAIAVPVLVLIGATRRRPDQLSHEILKKVWHKAHEQ